uniref:Uncharacterized protein LOC102801619 n=1 Tax=Saccoglossus kowalevskii TaxID=10224 RepID=A0ABM0MSW3_SACKO|nr:PREDICTED: uncharacterized protein LOC102801619 [Saccoglossus kowalevskii]
MDWPAYSPDMAPIEHLWDQLGLRVMGNHPPTVDRRQLAQWLIQERQVIPQRSLQRLVTSMRQRCVARVTARAILSDVMADEEAELLEDLLSKYNKLTRPVENKSDIVDVFIDLVVVKIPDITWIDYRLSWNASNYSDIQWLLVPSEKVWFPELYLENTFIEGELPSKPTYVRIESNGTVLSLNHAMLASHCYLDMTYFPFDYQTCNLKFSSITYYSTDLQIHVKENVFVDDFVLFQNYEWTVLEVNTYVNSVETSVLSPKEQPVATFEIHLERVYLYYLMNIIVPTFMLSGLSLCAFWLPPDCGERISLSVSLLVTMSVFELLVAEIIPTNTNKGPLIGHVILFDMAVIGTAVIISTIVINMQRKSTSGRPVGKVSRKLCLGRRCRGGGIRGRFDSTDNHYDHVVLSNIFNHGVECDDRVTTIENDALRRQREEYTIERLRDVPGKNSNKAEKTQEKNKCHQTQMEVTNNEWEALIRNVDPILSDVMADEEAELLKDLLSSYNKLTRPVETKSNIVDVCIDLAVVKIPDIDEKNKLMMSNVKFKQTWIDYRLSWNASNYSDIQWLLVPSEKVWFPELYLENTFIEGELPSKPTYVRIESNGTVLSLNHAMLASHCYLDMTYFPFDSQTCNIRFSSRTYFSAELQILVKENVSLDDFVLFQNYEWTVLEVNTHVNSVKTSVLSPEEQPVATFEIHLERVYSYYLMNIIVPTFMLSGLSLCAFWLPPDCGERISLSVSLLVTMSVFELLVAEIIPTNTNRGPLIGHVILFDMAVIGTAVIISTIVINMQRKSTSGRPVGKVTRKLCLGRSGCCGGVTRGRSDSTDNHHDSMITIENDAFRRQNEAYASGRHRAVSSKNSNKAERTQEKYTCLQTQMEVTKNEWEALIRNVDRACFYIYLFIFIAVCISVLMVPKYGEI